MYIGKVSEVRLTHKAADNLSKTQFDRLAQSIIWFNNRGGGSFKMCVQPTLEGVRQTLHDELVNYFKSTGLAIEGNIEFRINHNTIDLNGLAWEGFGIADGHWYPIK